MLGEIAGCHYRLGGFFMGWKEIILKDSDHLLEISSKVTHGSPFNWQLLFRGQSDYEWSLEPSLLRCFNKCITLEEALAVEKDTLGEFKSSSHRYISTNTIVNTRNLLQWWALMQHHNAPTRLLDWTGSIFVATYFAVEQNWDRDGVIWVLHARTLIDQVEVMFTEMMKLRLEEDFSRLQNPGTNRGIMIWPPDVRSERMAAQQGCFTFSYNILENHETIIDEVFGHLNEGSKLYFKIVIPSKLKPSLLRYLRSMNITANTLFPGIDGLGKSIAEQAKIRSYLKNLDY